MEQQNQEITVKEFEAVAKGILEKRKIIDGLKAQIKVHDEELGELEAKAQAMLETSEKDKYVSEFGTMYLSYYTSVTVPKEIEDKHKLFEYLREKELFDEVVTVNSQWLNGYYKREDEAARESGELFMGIPGVGMPKTTPRLGFRKA